MCPKIILPPINRDTPQNMPVLNGGISAGYLYFSLKSEKIGISRLPHKIQGGVYNRIKNGGSSYVVSIYS